MLASPCSKLKLSGSLPEKAVKNFWRLDVQREGNSLVIKKSAHVAYFGLKKPKKKPTKKKSHRSSDAKQQPAQAAAPKEPPKLKQKQTVEPNQ
jgi:TfoX/Sxy family transcriptional regulator of competence genes